MTSTPEITEVPAKRPSMTALFKNGLANGLQNQKHKRLFQSLQWRQAYLNAEYYEYRFDENSFDETLPEQVKLSPLRVKQILNGEMKGFGTGTFVWPAAHVLAKFLEKQYGREKLAGKRVCDIGSGTGLVGLIAGILGSTVVLTDLEILLPLMNENIEVSKAFNPTANISAKVYDWNNKDLFQEEAFDFLLISDCVLPKLYPIALLVDAVDFLLTSNTVALFSYEHRPFPEYDPRQEFRRLCHLKGLKVNIVPMAQHHPKYCAEDVEIWEVYRNDSTISMIKQEMNNPFQLLDWGEDKVEIPFQIQQEVYQLKQFSSLGVGGAIWPSSVICSKKIMTKSFQNLLAERLYPKPIFSLSPHLHSPPKRSPSLDLLINNHEKKKENLDFRGLTVLDLGAGCGLTSIVFHSLGFNVIATDKLAIMNLLEENIHRYLDQLKMQKIGKGDSTSCSSMDVPPLPSAVAAAGVPSLSSSSTTIPPTSSSEGMVENKNLFDVNEPFLKIIPFDWELENDSVKLYDDCDIDLVLCSDCLYNSMVVEPLIRIILMNVKRELLVLLVNELRTSLEEFLYLIRHYDPKFEVTVEEVVLTEPELELVRTDRVMKFAPPIRMCFLKFTRIGMSPSFDDCSHCSRDSNEFGATSNPAGRRHRHSSDSLS